MRIRRNASRLLGSASAFSHPPPPLSPPLPPSPPGLAVCQLNCSPWDLINTIPGPKEDEEEDDRGIAGICAELIEAEEPITATATADTQTSAGSAAEMKIEEEEEEIKELILEKEEDQVIEKKAEEEAAKCCNKRGKGWRCTRPAEPSHSFCSYHLTKLRSYLSSRRNNKTEAVRSTENRSQSKKRRPKKTTAAAAESDSNSYYYYYGGFGPWRGKRRGGLMSRLKMKRKYCARISCTSMILLMTVVAMLVTMATVTSRTLIIIKLLRREKRGLSTAGSMTARDGTASGLLSLPIRFAAITSPSSGPTTVPVTANSELLHSRSTAPSNQTAARRSPQ